MFAKLKARVAQVSWRQQAPELIVVVLALLLRLSMAFTYDIRDGFDWKYHSEYLRWIADHGDLPRYDMNVAAYHPPLYYTIGAIILKLGLGNHGLQTFSLLCGAARFLIIWAALKRYLPERLLGRLVALTLLAVLPAGLGLEAMGSNESIGCLLATLAMVMIPTTVGQQRPGLRSCALLGLVLGLALLTKFSAFVLCLSVALGVALDLYWRRPHSLRELGRRVGPLFVTAAVVALVAGWFYVRNQRLYGKAVLTGYDGAAKLVVVDFRKAPYLDRRPLGYFVGWSNDVLDDPYFPSGTTPRSRFFPVVVSSTFVDSFNTQLATPPRGKDSIVQKNQRSLRANMLMVSRLAATCGTVIGAVTMIAWLVVWRRRRRAHDAATVTLLLIPLLALVGQLHFAIEYPNDGFGPVKGTYLQFAAPPLFVLLGLAVSWLWTRWRIAPRVMALVCVLAVLGVVDYTLACRMPALTHAKARASFGSARGWAEEKEERIVKAHPVAVPAEASVGRLALSASPGRGETSPPDEGTVLSPATVQ